MFVKERGWVLVPFIIPGWLRPGPGSNQRQASQDRTQFHLKKPNFAKSVLNCFTCGSVIWEVSALIGRPPALPMRVWIGCSG